MAVKVMLAPAIARRAVEPAEKSRQPGARAKPRRRRSSVYDADGNEVFITLMCLKCRKMRPLSQFGLRKMADGAIRNQPWCRGCRSSAGADRARPAEEARALAESVPPNAGLEIAASPALPEAPARPTSAESVAAQVAAALAGGWSK